MKVNMFLKICLFLSCFLNIVGWSTSKTVSTTPQITNFNDDLSKYRISFSETSVKNTSSVETPINTQSGISSNAPIGSINAELDTLNARIASSNRNFTIKGYRIQVYSGMQRKDAEVIITDLKKILPNRTADLEYSQPNYKVKVGNFLNRIDAYQTYYKVREVYPNVSIVFEKIKVPRY